MRKKKIIFVVMLLALTFIANTAFAETTSTWSPSYSGVYYQYVNQFGGSDYDGLRWYNGNSAQVEVTYKNKLSNGSIVKRVINLSGGAAEEPAFWKFNTAIRAKYGSPDGFNRNAEGGIAQWYKLTAPDTSDAVNINLYFTKMKPPTLSNCTVEYINRGLEQRLALKKNNGL